MKLLEIRPSNGNLLRVGDSVDSVTDQIPTVLFTFGEGEDHGHIELKREDVEKLHKWLGKWLGGSL